MQLNNKLCFSDSCVFLFFEYLYNFLADGLMYIWSDRGKIIT